RSISMCACVMSMTLVLIFVQICRDGVAPAPSGVDPLDWRPGTAPPVQEGAFRGHNPFVCKGQPLLDAIRISRFSLLMKLTGPGIFPVGNSPLEISNAPWRWPPH